MRTTHLLLLAAALIALPGCADANKSNSADVVRGDMVQCEYPADGEPSRAVDPPSAQAPTKGEVTATLHLTAGDIAITMDRAKAPCNVNSIVSLIEQGYYDDTVCHRLTDYGIFVLQCGDPTATGTGGAGLHGARRAHQRHHLPGRDGGHGQAQRPPTPRGRNSSWSTRTRS